MEFIINHAEVSIAFVQESKIPSVCSRFVLFAIYELTSLKFSVTKSCLCMWKMDSLVHFRKIEGDISDVLSLLKQGSVTKFKNTYILLNSNLTSLRFVNIFLQILKCLPQCTSYLKSKSS